MSETSTAPPPDGPPPRGPSWTTPVAMVCLMVLPVSCCLGGWFVTEWMVTSERTRYETLVRAAYQSHPVVARQLGGLDRVTHDPDRSLAVQTAANNPRLAAFTVAGPGGEGELVVDLAAPPYGAESSSFEPTLTVAGDTRSLGPAGPSATP